MKAITISQPYAHLIATGEKWVENRSWNCNYRGPIAIHAGLGKQYLTKAQLAEYPTGCVIAIAKLAACFSLEEVEAKFRVPSRRFNAIPGTSRSWFGIVRHQYTEGPYCWILEDIQRIEPVKAVGKQGLWEWQPSAVIQLT